MNPSTERNGDVEPEEALSLFERLRVWDRWGAEDTAGALNHITPDTIRAAAATVSAGRTVSMSWDIDPRTSDEETPPERQMLRAGIDPPTASDAAFTRLGFASERIAMTFHGYTITHLDALAHCSWDGLLYGGRSAQEVSFDSGASVHDVRTAGAGITTRGVLIDAARHRGQRWLEPGETVTAEEVEEIESRQGCRIAPGDAVFLRTGTGRRRRETGERWYDSGYPGWDLSCLELFADREVSVIGADTANDALPNPYGAVDMAMPVHAVSIVALGLRLIDNCDLEELNEVCSELNRWTFLLSIPPLRLVGATGSPVNPIAVL